MNDFTFEEQQLMSIYNPGTRLGLIHALVEMRTYLDKDEQEKETGKYIRRERYAGACQRSFYVGEDITEQDIKAEFKHGILKLFVPKKEAAPKVENKKYVAIEG